MGGTLQRGRAGEALAIAYLELAGYEVVARNHKLAGVEIDVIARHGETTVLVEVKCRGRADYGGAALAVDAAKRERLRRAGRAVGERDRVRIDVVAVEMTAGGAVVRHYENAVTDQ